MTAEEYSQQCVPINGLGAVESRALPHTFAVTFCDATARVNGCTTRDVSGAAAPPAEVRATAVLDRDGRRYATGTDDNGNIRLNMHGPIGAATTH
jgi:hypothetical protein